MYTLILFTSLLNGLGQGVEQPSSGTYISDCATENNKGFFFAMFWAFYMGSQVVGNVIAAFVIAKLDQRFYVIIMTGFATAAAVLLFFLKKPIVLHKVQ